MNYWIEGSRKPLVELLGRVDILLVNDAEARQLAGRSNLLQAARWIQERGPQYVIVKKGEHGAILFGRDWMFFAPGYPLEEVYDPTGAGDAFAGGFLGYLSGSTVVDREELRRAVVYGSATGSYAVERFSIDRFRDLAPHEVARRVEEFREMTWFEHELEKAGDV
jgi:sugar/nucleoside kinase (ribokinase family)